MGKLAKFAFKKVENLIDNRYTKFGVQRSFKEINIYRSEYWDSEENKPVLLLLHGFGAEAKYQWFNQVGVLSEKYRIIMPNLLHFGYTDSTEDLYSVQDQVLYVKELLDHLSLDTCTILGASYGGLVGMEFTRQFPNRVNQIIIQGAPVKFVLPSDRKRVEDLFKLDKIHDLFIPPDPYYLGILMSASNGKKSYIPSYFLGPFHDKFYSKSFENKLKLMDALIAIRESYAEHEYDFDLPIHLIWGSNDPIVPLQRAEKLKEYFADRASLDVIKNGGHMANMVKTKQFNQHIKSHLKL